MSFKTGAAIWFPNVVLVKTDLKVCYHASHLEFQRFQVFQFLNR